MEPTLREIQLKCMEILDVIDSICRLHGISYSLCGGTVVGAHLYQGFLPWDDDLDLMMTRENYNRFVEIAPSSLPDHLQMINYQLCDDFKKPFTKVMNVNTTLVQKNGDVSGIFVDITVYDKIPNNWLRKIDIFFYKRSLTVLRGKIPGNSFRNKLRTLLLQTLLSDRQRFFKLFQSVVEHLGKTDDYSYAELFGAWAQTYLYPSPIFENYIDIRFEGKVYMIVRDYVEYLQIRYNRTDFHEPEERQVAPHYQYVDFSLPYKEYITNR